jgi:hypothetical protein
VHDTCRKQEVKGGYEAAADTLRKIGKPFQACYEASTGYGALYERVAPNAVKWIGL